MMTWTKIARSDDGSVITYAAGGPGRKTADNGGMGVMKDDPIFEYTLGRPLTLEDLTMEELKELSGADFGKWIPTSERLPEDNVPVLVCTRDTDPDCGAKEQPEITDGYHDDFGGGNWWLALGNRSYSDSEGVVVAWMPLPEPYKEEHHD